MRGGEKRGRVHQHVNTRHISPMGICCWIFRRGLWHLLLVIFETFYRGTRRREVWIALERVDSFHTLFSRRLCSAGPVYTYGLDTPYQQPSVRTHNSADTHGPRLRACLSESQSAFNPASTWAAIAARNDSQIWSSFQKQQHIKLKIIFLFLKMLGEGEQKKTLRHQICIPLKEKKAN
jgi:hypothetical protein